MNQSLLLIFVLAGFILLAAAQVLLMRLLSEKLHRSEAAQRQLLDTTLERVVDRITHSQTSTERGSAVMHQRLDIANQVVADVKTALARLEEKTGKVAELSGEIASLQRILQAPKMRGSLGEIWLAELISQIIPKDRYQLQYRFKEGEICDAVIFLHDNQLLPIDAKFSMETFVKALETESPEDKKRALKVFASDTKARIDEIAKKYIRPDQNTLSFAFMYVPAENVYYHAFVHDESEANLLGYAFEKRVIPVSPSSFFAHLQVVLFGLRGMEIEQSARDIQKSLTLLTGEFTKIRETYDKLGVHLHHAQQSYELTDRKLEKLEGKVSQLGDSSSISTLSDGTNTQPDTAG